MTVDNAGSDTADCENDGSVNNGDGAESTGIGNMGAPDEATANCETRTAGGAWPVSCGRVAWLSKPLPSGATSAKPSALANRRLPRQS